MSDKPPVTKFKGVGRWRSQAAQAQRPDKDDTTEQLPAMD